MKSSTTILNTFNDEVTGGQHGRDETIQFIGSIFDPEPNSMQDSQQENAIPNLDHFEEEVSEMANKIPQYNSPASELLEAITQEARTNPLFPSILTRINDVGTQRTLSEPTPRHLAFFQNRVTPTGSLRSLPSRGTWSSLSTLLDLQNTDHLESGDPNWLSDMLDEPAAWMFDDEDSTLRDHDVEENRP